MHHQWNRSARPRRWRVRWPGDGWDALVVALLLLTLLLLTRVQAAQAQGPTATPDTRLPITIFVETQGNAPLAGMTMTMYHGETVVATATTDAQGYADLLLRSGSYTALLDGTLPDGAVLHPGGPYQNIGGMPIYITPRSSLICYEVRDDGGTTPVICPLRFGMEPSGSQDALTVTPAVGTPLPRARTATPVATPPADALSGTTAGGVAPPDPLLAAPAPLVAPTAPAAPDRADVPWWLLLLSLVLAGAGLLIGYLLWGRPRSQRREG